MSNELVVTEIRQVRYALARSVVLEAQLRSRMSWLENRVIELEQRIFDLSHG